MIILKAEGTLAAVFHKTIKVMEQNVEWNETFAINNNTLILPGTLKSLFFSFDNKKVLGNVIEEPIKEEPRLMLGNALLENTINLVLYIFGKWGKIKGLTVEKDYRQLEQQMNDILREVEVQVSLDATQCRFYHEGIRITYEEVIERILEYMKPDYLNEEEEEQDDTEMHDVSDWEKKYQLGLWHKIVWKSYETGISKKKLSAKERAAGRIGNDFYITGYQCPECKKPMYMVVYPKNKEFHIDTDEGRVILARAYTCMDCHRFYTPKPYKLLMEGSIYMMDFEDDNTAYEDYQELLGADGQRISNSRFNRYESSAPQSDFENEADDRLEELYNNMPEMSVEEIFDIADMLDSEFYPQSRREAIEEQVDKAAADKGMDRNVPPKNWQKHREKVQKEKQKNEKAQKEKERSESAQGRSDEKEPSAGYNTQNPQEQWDGGQVKDRTFTDSQTAPQDGTNRPDRAADDYVTSQDKAAPSTADTRTQKQGTHVQLQTGGADAPQSRRTSEEEIAASQKEVLSIALAAKNKSYAELKKAYHTILEKNCPQSVKDSVTENVKDWMQKRGEKELQVLAEHFPQQYQKKVYQQFRQKFEEYNDIDNTKYMKQLEEKRDLAEQSALKAFVNQQKIRPGDRKKLLSLAEAIRPMEYEEKNKQIIIDQLKDRVKDIDRKAIEQICPDIFEMSFDEGKEAYQRIATGDFLPELKTDMLGRIRKRLEAMKKDECRSLVNKMIRDTGISEQTMEGFYPYDIRRMSNEACEDIDAIIANNALNTYAGGEAFEYPLLIFDSTKGENGKKGFVLTPDHVYYNGSMMAGTVKVRNIKEFYAESGLFHKGIYIRTMNNGEMKITGNYKADKEKMEQVSAIAASVAIVTGLPFLEPVAKGVLISAWSMAEAVNDMKILLSGGKVTLTKSKGGWRTSIGNITNGDKKEDSKGLSYKEYCQILIAVQNTGDSLYRIMDLIQINIQKRYNSEFLMSKSLTGFKLKATYETAPLFTAIPIVVNNLTEENNAYKYSMAYYDSY